MAFIPRRWERLTQFAGLRGDGSIRVLPTEQVTGLSGILPPEFSRRAVEHYCGNEWAVHLDDVMLRRTSWHYYFPKAAEKAERVADWMGELLGWSATDRTAELQRYSRAVATELKSSTREDKVGLCVQ